MYIQRSRSCSTQNVVSLFSVSLAAPILYNTYEVRYLHRDRIEYYTPVKHFVKICWHNVHIFISQATIVLSQHRVKNKSVVTTKLKWHRSCNRQNYENILFCGTWMRRQQYVHRNLSVAHTFTHICKANILLQTQSHTCKSLMFACVATQRNVRTIRHGTKRIFFHMNCAVAVDMLLPGATIVKENTPLTLHSPDIFFSRLHNESWHQSKYITGHESAKSRINEFRVNNVWHLITVCGLCVNANPSRLTISMV